MADTQDHLFSELPKEKLAQICELAQALSVIHQQDRVRQTLPNYALALLDAEYCSIQITEHDTPVTETLERRGGSGDVDAARKSDQLIVGWIMNNGTSLCCANLSDDERFPFLGGDSDNDVTVLAAPIRFTGDIIGALILARDSARPYSESNQKLVELIAALASARINDLKQLGSLKQEVSELRHRLADTGEFAGLVGRSPAWRQVCDVLRNIADSEARILLLGESGTGKELCARAIHQSSPRREQSFVAVNCAALPESLAESELFGYVKGSFTGATKDRDGLFGAANGGTLFLDEIGSSPPQVQSSLLRAIQEGEIRPVGSTEPKSVDVRLICATSQDLDAMVADGTFRKDLLYRINVVTLPIPALRERREDIAVLAQNFLQRFAKKYAKSATLLTPDTLVALQNYNWPGNVRELENAMERAILFTPPDATAVTQSALPDTICSDGATPTGVSAMPDDSGLDSQVEHYERELIRFALTQSNWNQSEAARVLHVPESRVRDRIKKYDLQQPQQNK